MVGRRDQYQLIAMNDYDFQSSVIHGHGDYAEVDAVIDDGLQDLAPFHTIDADVYFRVFVLEVREDLRQDVQAGAFIRTHHDLPAGNTVHVRKRGNDLAALVRRRFSIATEDFARSRK